eukprot:7040583-Karenia_brevis.AAC.1
MKKVIERSPIHLNALSIKWGNLAAKIGPIQTFEAVLGSSLRRLRSDWSLGWGLGGGLWEELAALAPLQG